jgi:hypothetical protein
MSRTEQKIWPKELLVPAFPNNKVKIYLITYEARFLERLHYMFNLPDHDIDEFADQISKYDSLNHLLIILER